ncbi:MAG TPA: hypothetical protein VM029_19065 [Opitutaceae bacterium]|nr:hypothetical protein [Opitutaceae bacterium]
MIVASAWLATLPLRAADDPVVALPPFMVEEAAKGPPWRYADLPGYEILSRCPDRSTKQVVETHYKLHQLLAEILPERLQVKMSVPKAFIVYDEELQPAASQEVIARLLRPEGSRPKVEMDSPIGRGFRLTPSAPRVSFLPNLRLWDRDAMAVFMIVRRDGFDADRLALTAHYVNYLVRTRLPALPLWFVSGFLSLYDGVVYDSGELTLPANEWLANAAAVNATATTHPAALPTLVPLEDFFAGRLALSDQLGSVDAATRWRAQAALFVRWGLDGRGAPRREALWKFVERSAILGVSEELFQECFGLDYAAAAQQLAAYLATATRNTVRFRAPRLPSPAMTLRNATDAQIARIKGDWERMEVTYVKVISPELAPKYLEQARRTLLRPYERDVRDPGMLAVMGLCEVDAGNEAGALGYLEAAARLGPLRPRAMYELARLRLAAFKAVKPGDDVRLDASQAAQLLSPLFAARAAEPPLPEVYELIAEVWACCEAAPRRAHLAVLDEGVRLFPRRSALVQRVAELNLQNGFREEAAALIAIGVRGAGDDATRDKFAEMLRRIEPW